jgi:hypothetical protein
VGSSYDGTFSVGADYVLADPAQVSNLPTSESDYDRADAIVAGENMKKGFRNGEFVLGWKEMRP